MLSYFEEKMSEEANSEKENEVKPTMPPVKDPGLLDHFGSFPVWILRIIQLITPDFLISKTPPEKKKTRI